MTFQKGKFTLWLTGLLASAFLFVGCGGPEVQLGFPLAEGNTWSYQGTTTYRIGNQEQTMPALSFNMTCHQLSAKPNAPFDFKVGEEGQALTNAVLVNSAKGIANPLTGELWLPRSVKVGKRWSFHLEGNRVRLILHSQTTRTVPAGTFPTYLVVFIGPQSVRGSLWIDPEVGIVALRWSSSTHGARSTTSLELSSYNLQ